MIVVRNETRLYLVRSKGGSIVSTRIHHLTSLSHFHVFRSLIPGEMEFEAVEDLRAGEQEVQEDARQDRLPHNVWSLPVLSLPAIVPDRLDEEQERRSENLTLYS